LGGERFERQWAPGVDGDVWVEESALMAELELTDRLRRVPR
jgi:hypothetical protein